MIIDVIHDTVCPWCRIGLRHLDLALAEWDGDPVEVRLHPYLLDETVPAEGMPLADYFRAKGIDEPEPMLDRVRAVGAPVNLAFRFDPASRFPNSLNSHRLIAMAAGDPAVQRKVVDGIHRAYFEQGRDIGDPAVLAEIAGDAGLDAGTIEAALRSDVAREDVLAAAREARSLGITGVPFFALDGRLAVSGAQPPQRLLDALRDAARSAAVDQ